MAKKQKQRKKTCTNCMGSGKQYFPERDIEDVPWANGMGNCEACEGSGKQIINQPNTGLK